jgi:hypothetical protein
VPRKLTGIYEPWPESHRVAGKDFQDARVPEPATPCGLPVASGFALSFISVWLFLAYPRRAPRFGKKGILRCPRKNHQAPADRVRARELADDDGPIFSTVAKLVDAFQRAVPHSRDLELREEALRLGRELLRSTKYEEGR